MVQVITLLIAVFSSFISFNVLRRTEILEKISINNYRNHKVPVSGGIIAFFSVSFFSIIFCLMHYFNKDQYFLSSISYLFLPLPFIITGFFDDVFGDKSSQGFKGHFVALKNGKITTGFLKLFFGVLFSGIVSFVLIPDLNIGKIIVSTILIAASSNLFNLFDLAPGRSLKILILILIPFLFFANSLVFILFGFILFLVIPDLGEHMMLGDSGANYFGALFGIIVVLTNNSPLLYSSCTLIVALNLASEVVSFSELFKKVKILNIFDSFGRKHE